MCFELKIFCSMFLLGACDVGTNTQMLGSRKHYVEMNLNCSDKICFICVLLLPVAIRATAK